MYSMIFRRLNRSCFLFLVAVYLFNSCANPLAPEGGPRDEQPPQLIAEESTPNYQTNFRPTSIELTFDEWVQIQDALRQVVISPPLQQPFETTLRRKTVIFSFNEEEVLRDSATYVINFGEAIQDITERNPAEDLRFVFATGPEIDSLKIQGQVVDAYTGEPKLGVLFMLYDVIDRDSIVAEEPPFYFARTDSSGNFTVSNVKEGIYRGLALEDSGFDYKYTQETEPVGFPDTLLIVDSDSVRIDPIRLYELPPYLRLTEVDSSQYGRLKLAFDQAPPDSIRLVTSALKVADFSQERIRDTLLLYYRPETIRTDSAFWELQIAYDTTLQDTLEIPLQPAADFLATDTLELIGGAPSRHNPTRAYPLQFNTPIDTFDTSLIQLLTDSGQTVVPLQTVALDTPDYRQVRLNAGWEGERNYELRLLPGAFTNWYGTSNLDTIQRPIQVEPLNKFGNLLLRFQEADSTVQYIVRLVTDKGELVKTYFLRGATTYERAERGLTPTTYALEIIRDTNANGRYDPGDYYQGRQPEQVFLRPIEALRANWDVEADISLQY